MHLITAVILGNSTTVASCSACCSIFPLEPPPSPDKNGGVVYLRIVLSQEEASRIYVSVFGDRLSRKSNNVVVFPFVFHIAVQQPFKPLWSRLLLYDLEPFQAPFALRFKSLVMTLLPASEEFDRSSLPLGISLRLVPTLLTCPAWEILLVAVLPPA